MWSEGSARGPAGKQEKDISEQGVRKHPTRGRRHLAFPGRGDTRPSEDFRVIICLAEAVGWPS